MHMPIPTCVHFMHLAQKYTKIWANLKFINYIIACCFKIVLILHVLAIMFYGNMVNINPVDFW
jgi:hypothetical protein